MIQATSPAPAADLEFLEACLDYSDAQLHRAQREIVRLRQLVELYEMARHTTSRPRSS
jgi:hypothetical protein